MTTAFTSWADEIRPDIPNVPEPFIIRAARDACIRFCEKTHLWLYTLDPIDVEEDTQDYNIASQIPTGLYADFIAVPEDGVYFKRDGEDDDQYTLLDCISEKIESKRYEHAWKFETAPDPSDFWVDNVDKKLHLRPIPTDESIEGLLVTVILRPSVTSTVGPNFLYQDYRKEIGYGALAYLYRMKKMPWYDPDQYKDCEAKFMGACGDGNMKTLIGSTEKQLTIDIPYFA